MFKQTVCTLLCALGVIGTCPRVEAQIPVTDIGAIAQLIQQLNYWQQQIRGMTDQLNQLRTTHEAVTGPRGMERLLAGTARNYLPEDWVALADALEDLDDAYSSLGVQLRGVMRANAVLSDAELARLSFSARQEIERQRRLAAMTQVMARQALATTSARFDALQELIDAIPGATDPKGVMDLQARIAVEQAMLQNEHTKIELLNQTMAAEEWARRQQMRERAITDIGSFSELPPLELP